MKRNAAAVDRDGGVLYYCRLNGITVQAWSSFQLTRDEWYRIYLAAGNTLP